MRRPYMSKHVIEGLSLIVGHMRQATAEGTISWKDNKARLDLEEATDYLERLVAWYREKRG